MRVWRNRQFACERCLWQRKRTEQRRSGRNLIGAPSRRKFRITARVTRARLPDKFNICGYGGIGRRAGFRFRWATVQVQILLSAPEKGYKIDVARENPDVIGVFTVYTAKFPRAVLTDIKMMFSLCWMS